MSHPVITVTVNTTLESVASTMLKHHIGSVPVVDDEARLIGIVTHTDFIAKEEGIPFSLERVPKLLGHVLKPGTETIYEEAKTMTAADIMTPYPVVLEEDDLVKTFLEKMLKEGITHAPVLRGGALVGIVAKHDLLKMIAEDASPKEES